MSAGIEVLSIKRCHLLALNQDPPMGIVNAFKEFYRRTSLRGEWVPWHVSVLTAADEFGKRMRLEDFETRFFGVYFMRYAVGQKLPDRMVPDDFSVQSFLESHSSIWTAPWSLPKVSITTEEIRWWCRELKLAGVNLGAMFMHPQFNEGSLDYILSRHSESIGAKRIRGVRPNTITHQEIRDFLFAPIKNAR